MRKIKVLNRIFILVWNLGKPYTTITLFILAISAIGCKDLQVISNINNPSGIEYCRNLPYDEEGYDFYISDKIICYSNFGKLKGNYEDCVNDELNYCKGGVAYSKNNVSICEDSFCYLSYGIAAKDIRLCGVLGGEEKSFCVLGVAVSKNDINLCDYFEDEKIFGLGYICKISIAKRTRSISICEGLEQYSREECYLVLALETKNVYLCNQAGDAKVECEKNLLIEKAIKEKNEKICYGISEFDYDVADCVVEVAKSKKDEGLCEDLPDWYGSVQQECFKELAIVNKDVKLCEKTYGEISVECYGGVLVQFKNPEEVCLSLKNESFVACYPNLDCSKSLNKEKCEKVIEDALNNPKLCEHEPFEGAKLDCYSSYAVRSKNFAYCLKGHHTKCVTDFAVTTNDISICDSLTYDQLHSCYRAFNVSVITEHKQKLGINDIQECVSFMGDDRDRCYLKQAKEKNNSELCEESGVFRSVCYEEIAISTKDPNLCENARDDCYFILAKDLKDLNLCNKINKSSAKRYYCYKELAAILKKPSFCELMKGDEDKDICYLRLVGETGNKVYCQKLKSEARKAYCLG